MFLKDFFYMNLKRNGQKNTGAWGGSGFKVIFPDGTEVDEVRGC